ncbi:MAG: hypothetical protein RIQ56_784, partial [Candidatus Parcubacteria bacterium]
MDALVRSTPSPEEYSRLVNKLYSHPGLAHSRAHSYLRVTNPKNPMHTFV